jgi:hypothetical protein
MTNAELQERLLNLSGVIGRDQKTRGTLEQKSLFAPSAEQQLEIRRMIREIDRQRVRYGDEIRDIASTVPQHVAEVLYHAAAALDNYPVEVPRLLAEAVAAIDAPVIEPAKLDADCYVTLLQMSAIVQRDKRTLRRLCEDETLPAPAIKGGSGKPNEWRWRDVRPILEKEYGKPLPDTFPADRFQRT